MDNMERHTCWAKLCWGGGHKWAFQQGAELKGWRGHRSQRGQQVASREVGVIMGWFICLL